MTKEVKVSRAEGVKFDLGLAAGRGKAHAEYKARKEYAASSDTGSQEDLRAPLQQFAPWPLIELAGYNDKTTLKNLMHYLAFVQLFFLFDLCHFPMKLFEDLN